MALYVGQCIYHVIANLVKLVAIVYKTKTPTHVTNTRVVHLQVVICM